MENTITMPRLPAEIWSHIYGFDPTYRERFDRVLAGIQKKAWVEKRLLRELVAIHRSPEFVLRGFTDSFVRIHFNGEEYRVLTTGEYPFVQPVVSCRGRRLAWTEWSPVCGLEALLRTYDASPRRKEV